MLLHIRIKTSLPFVQWQWKANKKKGLEFHFAVLQLQFHAKDIKLHIEMKL